MPDSDEIVVSISMPEPSVVEVIKVSGLVGCSSVSERIDVVSSADVVETVSTTSLDVDGLSFSTEETIVVATGGVAFVLGLIIVVSSEVSSASLEDMVVSDSATSST